MGRSDVFPGLSERRSILQGIDLTPIPFCGTARTPRADGDLVGILLCGFRVCLWRGQIVGVVLDEGRTDPGLWRTQCPEGSCDSADGGDDEVSGVYVPGRFGLRTIHRDAAAADGFDGIGPGFENTGGPEPEIEAHGTECGWVSQEGRAMVGSTAAVDF